MIDIYFLLIITTIILYGVYHFYQRAKYQKTSYYQETHTPYSDIVFNKGVRGEYHIATLLSPFQYESARLLYNLYIPTQNGRTTEVDPVLITRSGIFVIEVKNLSGWIFGNANQKYWCQTLPSANGCKKHHFYNPVWQNGTHIRYLRKLINQAVPFHSIIVFSDRCTLKQVSTSGTQATVVYASELRYLIQRIQDIEGNRLNDADILKIYTKLFPFSHVDDTTKNQHLYHISQYRH